MHGTSCDGVRFSENEFYSMDDALYFIQNYDLEIPCNSTFKKFEIIVWYNNNNRIDAQFSTKEEVFRFLRYVATS